MLFFFKFDLFHVFIVDGSLLTGGGGLVERVGVLDIKVVLSEVGNLFDNVISLMIAAQRQAFLPALTRRLIM